jgi:hypothetical protein
VLPAMRQEGPAEAPPQFSTEPSAIDVVPESAPAEGPPRLTPEPNATAVASPAGSRMVAQLPRLNPLEGAPRQQARPSTALGNAPRSGPQK